MSEHYLTKNPFGERPTDPVERDAYDWLTEHVAETGESVVKSLANMMRRRAGLRRKKAPEGECVVCDSERVARNEFHPPHDASPNCESGKHNHCSCDTCF